MAVSRLTRGAWTPWSRASRCMRTQIPTSSEQLLYNRLRGFFLAMRRSLKAWFLPLKTSVLDFTSPSGTRASPPVLLVTGDDPKDLPKAKDNVPPPQTVICLAHLILMTFKYNLPAHNRLRETKVPTLTCFYGEICLDLRRPSRNHLRRNFTGWL